MDDDIRKNFILKTRELLRKLENYIVNLNENSSRENIQDIFRIMHSIKGNAMILENEKMVKISHAAEDLIEKILYLNQSFYSNRLLESMFRVKDRLEDILNKGQGNVGCDDVLEEIQKLQREGIKDGDGKTSMESKSFEIVIDFESRAKQKLGMRKSNLLNNMKRLGRVEIIDDEDAVGDMKVKMDTDRDEGEIASFLDNRPFVENYKIQKSKYERQVEGDNSNRDFEEESYLSVKSDKLKNIIGVMEDITTTASLISEMKGKHDINTDILFNYIDRQNKLLSKMESLVMELRMVSVNFILDPIKRMVVQSSLRLKKEVDFLIEDDNVEIDRAIVDKLSLIMSHIIKNSIDHGIEYPDERLKKGKDRRGTIHVRTFAGGGSIRIQIEDDGKGLDTSQILEKSLAMGIVQEEDKYTEEELQKLVFEKGLSTKSSKSEISGRGMGMDIVKEEIQKFGGRLVLFSEKEKGVRIDLILPSNIHINHVINVKKGVYNYSIPIKLVREILPSEAVVSRKTSSKKSYGSIKGKIYEIIDFEEMYEDKGCGSLGRCAVIVSSADGEKVVVADEILGEGKVVIKKLEAPLRKIRGICGISFLNGGMISLVVDSLEL